MMARPAPLSADDARLRAFKPGRQSPETAAQIAQKRAELAELRKKREIEARGGERRKEERRAGDFDRRNGDRRFHTMDDKLRAEAKKQDDRRFTGAPLTDFGDSL